MSRGGVILLIFLLAFIMLSPVFSQEAECGDGDCADTEDCESCPDDCLPEGKVCCDNTPIEGDCCSDSDCAEDYVCESNICIPVESEPVCGDGDCADTEDCESCPDDCGECVIEPVCGNGLCEDGEDAESCPDDCSGPAECGNGVCESGEDCESCPSDCGDCELEPEPEPEEPEPVSVDIDAYKSSLSLSSDAERVAIEVISNAHNCKAKVNAGDFYEMSLECRKNEYYITQALSDVVGLSDAEWAELTDYIMLNTDGEADYWVDAEGNIDVSSSKQLIDRKLHFSIDRWESYGGGLEAHGSLHIQWDSFSLSSEEQEEVQEAEQAFWDWQEQLRKNELKEQVSDDFSSDEVSLADELIDVLSNVEIKIKAYDASYDSSSAYDLAYAQRLAEAQLRGLAESSDSSVLSGACDYAALNGPGEANIWENEFGEVDVEGSQVYRSDSHKGLEAYFNCWEDDGEIWVHLGVDFDREGLISFKNSIRQARDDAEQEARALEVAGRLSEFLETFTISDDNKELAEEIVTLVDDVAADATEVELTTDSVYSFNYDTIVKNAEIEGIAEVLTCAELSEVGPYVMIYSEGTPEIHEDEFGELEVSSHKQVFENDFLRLNLNHNCDDFNDRVWMSLNSEWGGNVTRNDELADALRNSEEAARREAERVRMRARVVRARRLYNFTLEQEEVGDEIIALLESFKDKIVSFEASPSAEGAYDLMYDSILLSAEVEGIAQAYRDDARMIGLYVMLYGPGVAEVWDNQYGELEVGHNLNVYYGDDLEFNFNQWFDDRQDRAGFNTWLNFGRLRSEYRDEIKAAEREAWIEADLIRKRSLASKKRSELSDAGITCESRIAALKDYLILFNKYLNGNATAFDLELKRLQVSDQMHELNEGLKDCLMVAELGSDVPPPDIWLDWELDKISVGGWRELVKFNESLEQPFTGMSGWCDVRRNNTCGIDLHIDWFNWDNVREDINRANELFWRQKREEELADELNEIIALKDDFSASDQEVESSLVRLINDLESVVTDYESAESLQYNVLVKQDEINDKLNEASDQSIIHVAVADADGFHEYDEWLEEVRGVIVYSDKDLEIAVRFNEEFKPFFLENKESENESVTAGEFEVFIELMWKDWKPELQEDIEAAYERYEREQSQERFDKLVGRRADFVPDDLKEQIRSKVSMYEDGEIGMRELKRFVNNFYYHIMGYDNEVAYLAALSENEFPDFELVNIVINTEHVSLQLYERDFVYRFGGEARVGSRSFAPSSELEQREIEFLAPELIEKGVPGKRVESGRVVETRISDVEVTPRSAPTSTSGSIPGPGPRPEEDECEGDLVAVYAEDGSVLCVEPSALKEPIAAGSGQEGTADFQYSEAEAWDEETVEDFERKREELVKEKREVMNNINEERREIFKGRKVVKPKGFAERKQLSGIKPRLKFSVDMTAEEVKRLAEEIKSKWAELNESGVINDIVYNINLDIDEFPALADAVREWGDVTTSFRLKYQNESVFEISFKTEDGYIMWVDYGVVEGAGVEPETVFIEVDFESIMRLKNKWERGLKNADNIFDVISSLPGMFGEVVGMLTSGEILIQPFGVVFRIPNMMKVMFEAMMEGSGISI